MQKRGKRYQEASKLIDTKKTYPIMEALDLAKKTSTVKFDASIEVHCRLGIDSKKSDQQVRGTITLPHGLGKSKRIAVISNDLDKLNEAKEAGAQLTDSAELLQKIKEGKIEFDVLVTTPDMMKDLAPLAKILGPRGLMPNPKNETVTLKIKEVVSALAKGRADFKNDDTGNIHQIIGKASFSSEQLSENYQTLLEAIKKAKPSSSKGIYLKSIAVCSTMGPGIKVQL